MTQIIEFYEDREILIDFDQDGAAWLRANDVCRELGFNPAHTSRILDSKVFANYKQKRILGMGQPAWFLSEAGCYQLLFQSHSDEARSFQSWVFDEVLPTIRKKGLYATDEAKETIAELVKSMVSFRAYFDARRDCTSDRNDPLKKLDTAKLAKLDDGFEMAVYELCEILGLDPDDFSWSETDDIPALHKLYDEVEAAQSKRKRK